ncbi:MAG TPA: VWA domain-containing protein, partial [Sedimenticola sp.]|nr:VWA domain-containing protein [Sedimenticola sp.]
MTDFHFLRPAWLLALLPLFGLLLLRLRAGAGGDPWRGIVDPYLLRHLRPPVAHRRPVRRILLPAAGALLAVLALAGPAWERVPPPRVRTAVPPLVILLDLSRSMTATDVSPSRLAVARTLIHSLLQRLPPREVGLVVFAGGAHRVMPLTEDRRLIQSLLPRLEPGLMPVQGSNASAALRLAGRLLVQDGRHRGDLLLVTDSVDPSARARAAELAEAGIRVSVAGIGTRAGGPVPDPETGRLASAGRPVTVRLEATQLQAVARAGGGVYREGLAGLDGLLQGVERGNRGGMTGSAPETGPRVWRDRGPWLLLPLLALGLPAFRRGGALGLLLLPLLWPLLLSPPASAGGWERLWLNPGQQAERLLRRGEYRAAAERYRDPLRKGVALYLAGDYAAAAALLARSDQALAHYDRGNALLRLGRTREAIQAYQRALSLQPGYRKARDNLALARRLLAAAEGRGRSLSPPDARKRQRPPDRPGNKKRHTAADSNPPVARPPGHRPGREQRRPGPGGGNAQAPGATRPGP